VQPLSVGLGFRIYMTIPPFLGALLAIAALWFYPLRTARQREIKDKLAIEQESCSE
jgi:GPH family glycoside/pentoside/hexuronide:cation symporter